MITRTDIRTMRRNGDSAWEILATVVASGIEFPDAEFLVSSTLNLDPDEHDEMIDGYDNNC
jgi:hypothetical protein